MKIRCISLAAMIAFGYTARAQVVAANLRDSLGSHPVIRDAAGDLLPWYKPSDPGASYAHVVRLASEFIKSGTPVDARTGLPMYLVTCCFSGPHMTSEAEFRQGKTGEDWMHNPAMTYAGMVHSLVTGYRVYSGDSAYIGVVRGMLDHQLNHGTTPSSWEWPRVPYASSDPFEVEYQGATKWEKDGMRGDGLHGIEPDKVGELGYAYLVFYETTGDTTYLSAAIHCADALAKHVRDPGGYLAYFSPVSTAMSPWPFRVNARTGVVIDQYCSNVIEPIKLFDELLRIGNRIAARPGQTEGWKRARDIAWKWLFSKNGPMKTSIWNAYFEDIASDPEKTNRNQVSPLETARYLIANKDRHAATDVDVPSLIHWVESVFGTEGMYAIKEQTWCYVPMGSHTARFASVCALWYERSGDERYRTMAYRYFNNATYCADANGVVRVGHTWPGTWFSDGYSDYIRHFIEGMAAVPEWAPAGENHVLRSSSTVRTISYAARGVNLTTFDNSGEVVMRLARRPSRVVVGGRPVPAVRSAKSPGYTWDNRGVLRLRYEGANEIQITY